MLQHRRCSLPASNSHTVRLVKNASSGSKESIVVSKTFVLLKLQYEDLSKAPAILRKNCAEFAGKVIKISCFCYNASFLTCNICVQIVVCLLPIVEQHSSCPAAVSFHSLSAWARDPGILALLLITLLA